MLTLRLLGTALVSDGTGPVTGRAVQRRRMAILALLGCAAGRTVSRDKLIAYLWPDSPTEVARHRLSVALHDLRKVLGKSVILSSNDDVSLDPRAIFIDVVEFDRAFSAGDWARAVALYRGPLLDGFHLDECGEFAHRVDLERDRLARAYGEALQRMAEYCRQRGDVHGEIAAWRKLAAHDPLSSRAAVSLMTALHSAGERSGALQHARHHGERLREEFDLEPDAEFSAVVAQLRALDAAPAYEVPRAVPPITKPPGYDAPLPQPRGITLIRRTAGLSAALLLFLLVSWTAMTKLGGTAGVTSRIAVLPFRVHGNTELAYLREGMVDLLSTSLDGAGDMRTIDPQALFALLEDKQQNTLQAEEAVKRLDATAYVTGTVLTAGSRIRLQASLHDAATAEVLGTAEVDGEQSELFALVDDLTTRLIASHSRRPREHATRIAALTTKSLPALKAYLAGERDFRAGRFVAAADAFGHAASLDSTFALANYRLALSMLWADIPDTLPYQPEQRALRHSENLAMRDRLTISAYVAWRNGDAEAAEVAYRQILGAYPEDVEAWHQLGETLFHYNPLRGRTADESRHAFERVSALDPNNWSALWHRALLAGGAQDWQRFDELSARLQQLRPEPTQSLELIALRAYLRGDHSAIARLTPDLEKAPSLVLFQLAWRVAAHAQDIEAARRLLSIAARSEQEPGVRWLAHSALASLALGQGKEREAKQYVDIMAREGNDAFVILKHHIRIALHPFSNASRAELESLLRRVSTWQSQKPSHELERLGLTGLLAARLGNAASADSLAAELERKSHEASAAELHAGTVAGLRARAAALRGRPDEALRLVTSARNKVWFGWSIGSTYWSQAGDRYLRAELLRQAGRFAEALLWYESLEQYSVDDLSYLGPSLYRRAQIYEQTGQNAEAARLSQRLPRDPTLRLQLN